MKNNGSQKYIIGVILVLLAAVAVLIMYNTSQNRNVTDEATTSPEISAEEKWQEEDISYNGKTYRYNNSIRTYLLMGIDIDGIVAEAEDGISGGQSDANFLVVVDKENEKTSIIAINRNAMTTIDVYDKAGEYLGTDTLQLCLQHAYGDGKRISCQRSVDTVSRMFYNIPIHGYFAMNMGGIGILNDAVGGVTVDIKEDVTSQDGTVVIPAGDNITLHGREAYDYLQKRDINQFNSATARLERQETYFNALVPLLKEKVSKSSSFATSLFSDLSPYTETNIEVADLVERLREYSFSEENMYTVPGEMIEGREHEEYIVDDAAFYEMLLDVFYTEVA